MRLIESAYYSDAALSVYIKIKALGLRPEGCTAGLATLASYLGLSVSTVQRGLAQLRSPGPDGVVELPDSRRRSLPGGWGTTARRRVRPLHPSERFIWLPVAASEHLRPRSLRAYAVIAYAVVRNIPLTEGVLANFLRHHSGRRAGQALTVDAAGRIVDELDESGWISVQRRAGSQGRHLFLVHDHDHDHQVIPSSGVNDQSGPPPGDRSLAYEEDVRTDRHDENNKSFSPAVGELPVDEAVENPDPTPSPAETPGDHALRAGNKNPTSCPATFGAGSNAYRGPELTFSARLHTVLAPVRFLLPEINTYVQRRIGQEISRQLEDGTEVQRLKNRLTCRLAQTLVSDIRDPGRWLLGVALPRWGCANPDCESGTLWSTGEECRACRETRRERAEAQKETTAPASGAGLEGAPEAHPESHPEERPEATVVRIVECCPDCDGPQLPGDPGLRPRPAAVPDPEPASVIGIGCQGRGGTCGRPAPRGLCWRCRVESEAQQAGTEPAPTGARPAPHL